MLPEQDWTAKHRMKREKLTVNQGVNNAGSLAEINNGISQHKVKYIDFASQLLRSINM
jgi:hypothetical protein